MTKQITPRWEWRLFDKDFTAAREKISSYQGGNRKFSDEVYILSRLTGSNVKLRNNYIEVKVLITKNQRGLEQWAPAFRTAFPPVGPALVELLSYLGLPAPGWKQPTDTGLFLPELIRSNPSLRMVKVTKEREIYVIDQCIVEMAYVTFDGKPHTTICVEHADPNRLSGVISLLGLNSGINTSYVQALKHLNPGLSEQRTFS